MLSRTDLRALIYSAAIVIVIFALGLWLGLFETFGGYVNRQSAIQLLSVGIGAGGGIYWFRRSTKSWQYFFSFLIVSFVLFQAGDVIGQALYYRPSSLQEFGKLVILAIDNEL